MDWQYFSNISRVACVALTICISACQFKKSDNKDLVTSPTEIDSADVKDVLDQVKSSNKDDEDATILNSDVLTHFEDGDVNRYTLYVRLPSRVKVAEISLNQNEPRSVISGNQVFQREVFANSSFTILVQTKSRGKIISQITKVITAPTDFVLPGGGLDLAKDTTISAHRVYLQNGSKIVTNGFNLTVNADKFVAERARILTFPSNSQSDDTRVLKSGSIIIQAKSILGNLHVSLRGVNGVPGRSGAELEDELRRNLKIRGADGKPGKSHLSDEVCTYDRRTEQEKCRPGVPVCDQPPTNGEKGPAAPAALNGEDGTNGGNQGNLAVITEDISQANVTIETAVGLKGRGGEAGPRHQFPGGKPGAMDPLNACAAKPAISGALGDLSAPGKRGADGIDGNEGTLVLPRHLPDFEKHFTVQKVR